MAKAYRGEKSTYRSGDRGSAREKHVCCGSSKGTSISPIGLLQALIWVVPTGLGNRLKELTIEAKSRVWGEALMRAMVLVQPKILPRLLEDGAKCSHDETALSCLARIVLRFVKDPKAICNKWRKAALCGPVSDEILPLRGSLSLRQFTEVRRKVALFQLSRVGRAGPYPTAEKVLDMLKQHKLDMENTFRPARVARKSFERFCNRWAHGKELPNLTCSYGTSGGLTTSRAKGGWRQGVREAVKALCGRSFTRQQALSLSEKVQDFVNPYVAFEPQDWEESLTLIDENGEETMSGASCLFQWRQAYQEEQSICHYDFYDLQRPHLLAIAACVELVMDGLVDSPDHLDEVGCVVIMEKSEKVRLVTPNEDVVAFVGSLFNSWLLGLLRQDPRVDPNEEPKYEYPRGVEIPEGFVIRSVDLVRASDRITGYDHRGCMVGLLNGLGIPLDSVFGRTLLFFARPVWVRGRSPDGVRFRFQTLGQPCMGRGPTWPILSLLTLWCVSAAKGVVERVVGDDALFASTPEGSEEFNRRLRSHNGDINDIKDVVSVDGGTLVERMVLLGTSRKLEWHDTLSVAVLDGKPKVERGESRAMPRFCCGPSIPYAEGVEYICEKSFAEEFSQFRLHGLDPFLPREFGGPGFPCSAMRRVKAIGALRPHWVRALRVAISQGNRGIGILLRLQEPWKSTVTSGAANIRDAVMKKILDEQQDWGDLSIWEDKASVGLTPDEFAKEVESLLVSGKAIWYGYGETKTFPLSIGKISEHLGQVIKEINFLVPKRKFRDPVRKMEEGLDAFLTSIRSGFFRMPTRYRTVPKIGTTRGFAPGNTEVSQTGEAASDGLGPSREGSVMVDSLPSCWERRGPFSSGERTTGALKRGTNMGMVRTFHKRWLSGPD